jgi:hypothetical protein
VLNVSLLNFVLKYYFNLTALLLSREKSGGKTISKLYLDGTRAKCRHSSQPRKERNPVKKIIKPESLEIRNNKNDFMHIHLK